MDVFEKILSEIDKGIKTIKPLMKGRPDRSQRVRLLAWKKRGRLLRNINIMMDGFRWSGGCRMTMILSFYHLITFIFH